MEQDSSKPKMNTIGILNEIQRLYSILEENDGDLDSISIDEVQSLEDHKKDLKNKVFDELRDGKPQNFIKNFLDPLNNQFLTEVRNKRSKFSREVFR